MAIVYVEGKEANRYCIVIQRILKRQKNIYEIYNLHPAIALNNSSEDKEASLLM